MVVVMPVPIIMPKRVAARPATGESSTMIERWSTSGFRLEVAPRVIQVNRRRQALLHDFFMSGSITGVSRLSDLNKAADRVEFFS
jgi:hypothetical protein